MGIVLGATVDSGLGELLLPHPRIEKPLNPLLDERLREDILHARPLRRVLAQQLARGLAELRRHMRRQRGHRRATDLHHERGHHGSGEGRLQRDELIEDHAEGPYVALRVVLLALAKLGCQVEGRANASGGDRHRVGEGA